MPTEVLPVIVPFPVMPCLEFAINQPETSETRKLVFICVQSPLCTPIRTKKIPFGCTAEIIKVSDDHKKWLLVGLQLAEIVHQDHFPFRDDTFVSIFKVKILGNSVEELPTRVNSGCAAFPPFVYNKWSSLQALADHSLTKLQKKLPLVDVPSDRSDPVKLLYWILLQLPLNLQHLSDVLLYSTESVAQKYYELDKILDDIPRMECPNCQRLLAETAEIVQIPTNKECTGDNICRAFVNPGACIYNILTVKRVVEENVIVYGPCSLQSSWFLGYAWQALECVCGVHVGWKFHSAGPFKDTNCMESPFFALITLNKRNQAVFYQRTVLADQDD